MSILHRTIPVEGGALPLTIAQSNGTGAAVLFMPSAFGVAPDVERQIEELAADARIVVSFDPFFRHDPGFAIYGDMKRVMARIGAVDRERAYADAKAALAVAREAGPVVMVGVCFGGPFSLLAAADGLVDGVVTWHGSRMENWVGRANEMRVPMRLHFGAVDPVTPPESIDAVRTAFAGRDDVEIVIHEGATHGYSHPDAPVYEARAERAGMAAVRELVRAVAQRAT